MMMKNAVISMDAKYSIYGYVPKDWNIDVLVKVAKIKRGRFSPRPRDNPKYYGGEIPFVQTGDVSNADGRVRTYSQTLNREGLKVSVLFPKGTILMTIAANIGHTAILEMDMACPDSLVGIICNDNIINNEYLNYHLNHVQKRIEYIAPGAQKNINIEFLESLPIVFPAIVEQKAIVSFLNKMDEAISKTTQLVAQKERRKKWLMQQLLTGKKRLKGFEGAWKECHLGDVFEERVETGYNDLPLLSIGQSGIYPQAESVKKDTSNEDKSKYRRICPDDIGYNTMRMWQGRSALSQLEGIVSPAYTIVTPKKNADSLFFSYLFKTPRLMHLFWRNSQGLVDDTLNCKFKDFAIVKVHLPVKKEQTSIAHILQTADQEIQLLKTQVEKMQEQKKGMMQVLLTGKKRLKH